MSIKDRLSRKTADLVMPAANALTTPSVPGPTPSLEPRTPRTGPGQMLAFRVHMQQSDEQMQALQGKLDQYAGSKPVRLLDPSIIRPSKWANRHSSSFSSQAFELLKADIASAGVNVQPIQVRPLKDQAGYELVFGHRRHQACLQLGIQVAAVIDDLGDHELFLAMDRENRAREDLSPFEQGEMYRRALDEGLYPSLRQLAGAVGVDPGNASKAIAIARLPKQVLEAFRSPNDIQFRWGQEIQGALQKSPEVVLQAAHALGMAKDKMSPQEIFGRLIGKGIQSKAKVEVLIRDGKAVGRLSVKAGGALTLDLAEGCLNTAQIAQLRRAINELLTPRNG